MNLPLPTSYIARLISLFIHLPLVFYRAKKLLKYNSHMPCVIPFMTVVIIVNNPNSFAFRRIMLSCLIFLFYV
jgi:hypothetical protein